MTLSWLLTSTTYGTWLPGDPRGFVGHVRDTRPEDGQPLTRVRHNQPGTPYDRDLPGLHAASQERRIGEALYLTAEQARLVCEQFQESATFRGWTLHAAAVMANHFHIVVTAPDSTRSEFLLQAFKAYASRILNERWAKPASGRWWTRSGSRRRLPNDSAVAAAVKYVLNQHRCLASYQLSG